MRCRRSERRCRRRSKSSRSPINRSSFAPPSPACVREAVIAACLTGIMILIFLGSWRSTIIIAVSIPLSILVSICCLSAIHETINIMTLGGLALAVGILVDDATVEIENVNRNLELGKELRQAILDGAQQIAVPAFVATLCICIVFLPMFFLSGVAKFLFVPLAEAVVFAMLASYLLSRTLVPTLAMYLLKPHDHAMRPTRNPFTLIQRAFERGFERLRLAYELLLTTFVYRRFLFVPAFLGALRGRLFPAVPLARSGLLPHQRQWPDPSAPAGQNRHAHRGNRAIERSGRSIDTPRRSLPPSWTASSTTWDCPTAASTPPTTPAASSARPTPTS